MVTGWPQCCSLGWPGRSAASIYWPCASDSKSSCVVTTHENTLSPPGHPLSHSTAGGHSDKGAVSGRDHESELHQEEVSAASSDVVMGGDHGQHLTCH